VKGEEWDVYRGLFQADANSGRKFESIIVLCLGMRAAWSKEEKRLLRVQKKKGGREPITLDFF